MRQPFGPTALGLLMLLASVPAPAQELRAVGQLRSPGVASGEASEKIVSHLRALIEEFRAEGITRENAAALGADRRFSSPMLRVDDAGRVHVYVTVTDTSPATLAALRQHGLDIEIVNPQFGIVQGWVPVGGLESLAGEPAVLKIRPPSYGTTRTGAVTTQGDAIHRCADVRTGGVTGAGVKVGVISDGVSGLGASQAIGDLPPSVQVLSAGTGDEGTAMLEIIHDCAPGAALAFSSGFPTSLAFINSVNNLAANNAKVIVDDLGFFSEPFFEDGQIALNDRAISTTAVRVSAAGNDRQKHYAGTFTPGPFDSQVSGTRHLFGPGDSLLRFRVGGGGTAAIVLQWANRFGSAADDYDLCVRQTSGVVVTCSLDVQNGNDDPIEAVTVSCSAPAGSACAADIQITRFSGSTRLLKLFCLGSCALDEFRVATGSIIGHPGVPEVVAVAASPTSNPAAIESFSSAGPHTIFFPASQTRSKPDVTGIDCVVTTRPSFNPFCGTSAAAPHVAAIAALVLQSKPGVGASELRRILRLAAVDRGVASFDSDFGFGQADALNGTLRFVDVHTDNPFRPWIEALSNAGVTGGCSTMPLLYCPTAQVTREQMAVFLLRAKEGAAYMPPACGSAPFADVPCTSPFATWIQELANRGVTAGCGGSNYCPASSVTRQEMAVFIVRALGVTPPACTFPGPFADVPCTSPFAPWIQELVARGITAGCGATNYCPTDPVTRAQMAVFLVRAFSLPFP